MNGDGFQQEARGGEHAMAIAGESRSPTPGDIAAVAVGAEIDSARARSIVEEVAVAVEGWPSRAQEARVPRKRIGAVARMLTSNASLDRIRSVNRRGILALAQTWCSRR